MGREILDHMTYRGRVEWRFCFYLKGEKGKRTTISTKSDLAKVCKHKTSLSWKTVSNCTTEREFRTLCDPLKMRQIVAHKVEEAIFTT